MHADHQLHKLHAALMQSGQAAGSSTLNKTKTAHWAGRGKWHSCQQPDEPSVTNTIVAGMHTGMAAPLSHWCSCMMPAQRHLLPSSVVTPAVNSPLPPHTDQVSALLNASSHAAIRFGCMTLTVQASRYSNACSTHPSNHPPNCVSHHVQHQNSRHGATDGSCRPHQRVHHRVVGQRGVQEGGCQSRICSSF